MKRPHAIPIRIAGKSFVIAFSVQKVFPNPEETMEEQ